MDFNTAFDHLITFEGGFSHRSYADDPGGATKYGISQRAYPSLDIENLTIEQAKQIYKKDFWDACQCDAMPNEIRYPLFDAAVNSGVSQAIKWMQSAAGVKADGAIGPMTKNAVNLANPALLCKQMIGKRLRFMTELKNWSANARGWSKRIAAVLEM